MESRVDEVNSAKMETVEIGDVDSMSIAAADCGLPLCETETPLEARFAKCSRVKGHDEGEGSVVDHVATIRPSFRATAIWRN